jgi:putative transposase
VTVKPLLKRGDDWGKYLSVPTTDEKEALIHRHEQTGRPLGSFRFVHVMESRLSRILLPQKGGRPKKERQ